ncbi:MAG: CARDB domain-containing protein, partial [Thermoanaerobaculia bacterium]
MSPRDTARAIQVQLLLKSTSGTIQSGLSWLGNQHALPANEFLAEKAMALRVAGVDPTLVLQQLSAQHSNVTSDYGGFATHNGNTYDSALALEAFAAQESTYSSTLGSVVSSLLARQNADGGWGLDKGFDSQPAYTAEVLAAITSLRSVQPPPAVVTRAQQYLVGKIQNDGSVAPGDLISTALTYRALAVSGYPVSSLPVSPLTFLPKQQLPDGSWLSDAYVTSRVLEAFASNKANLVITSFKPSPAATTDGSTVTATITIANTGTVATSATTVTLSVGTRTLGSTSVPGLAPGAIAAPSISFTVSQLNGTQTLAAVVDPANTIDELRKDDNQATATLTVTGKPDLVIYATDISVTPSRLQPNQAAQVLVTIHNQGQGDASNVGYVLYDSFSGGQTQLAKATIVSIAALGSQTVSVPVSLAGGTHTLSAIADPDHLIVESDESNNQATKVVTVNTVSNVDLALGSGRLTVTPTRPTAGQTVTLVATVLNNGTDPVQSTLAFYDGVPGSGGLQIASFPISIGGQSGTQVTKTYTVTASSQVIYAVADPDNTVPEIDETNNVAFVTLTDQVVDLTIRTDGIVLPRVLPTEGQNVTGRVVARNIGLLPASHVEVVFYDDVPEAGGVIVSDTFVDLPASGTAVVSATWKVRAGQHFATGVVNPTKAIAETDYTNNRMSRLYTTAGSGPDIFVDMTQRANPAASIDLSGLTVSPANLTVSGTVRATVHLNGVTRPFAVTVFEDVDGDGAFNPVVDNALGTTIVQPITDPQVVQIPVQGTVRFAPSHLYLYLDSGNAISEINEANNFVDFSSACQSSGFTMSPLRKWSATGLRSNQFSPVARFIDTNNDGVIDENDIPVVVHQSNGNVFARRGDTGQPLWVHGGVSRGFGPAIGDVDGDGHTEVIAHADEHRLICLADDGTVKWTSAPLDRDPLWDFVLSTSGGFVEYQYTGTPLIADLDGDGHPEVISGRTVLNGADGTVKWVGSGGAGRAWANNGLFYSSFPDQEQPIAVDLDGDGQLEVVAGNTAYRANGSIYWYRSDLPDGYTAALFLPGDPVRKVCLVANGNIYLLNGTTGATVWGPIPVPGGAMMGGAPTVFMDGANGPRLGIAGDGYYSVLDGTTGTVIWSKPSSAALGFNTALNSATAFDFGGGMTLSYQSIDTFWIFRASDGVVLYQEANVAYPYWAGSPVVADVDGDGRADIVIPGREDGVGLHVIGDPTWNGAPAVFNEATYHVTNVAEKGTIPQHEADSAFSKVFYRANPSTVLPATTLLPNLTTSYVRADTTRFPTSVAITGRVGNVGGASVPAGVSVAFFSGNPSTGGALLGTAKTQSVLSPSGYEDVTFTWNSPPAGTYTFYVIADDDGAHHGTVVECNESDNTGIGTGTGSGSGGGGGTTLTVDIATINTNFFVSDPFPRQGDTITLGASALLFGAIDASKLFAQFYLGDPKSGGTPISGLIPVVVTTSRGQQSGSVSSNWTVNAPVGAQNLVCVFDPQNLIVEADETNNSAATTIQVSTTTPIKTIAGGLTLTPPSAEANRPVTISALLQNIGNVPLTNVVLNYSVTTSGGGGSPLFSGSATITSLPKFNFANLTVGTFTPTTNGAYTVTVTSADPSVTLIVGSKTVTIGAFAGATMTAVPSHIPVSLPLVQCHINVSRTNTIVVPDDPLQPVVRATLQKGLDWEAPVVKAYAFSSNCFRCHVQAQGLTGLEASRQVSGVTVDDAVTTSVFNQMVSFQTPAGDFYGGSYPKTTATLGAWSLSYWHDQVVAKPYLIRSLDYLVGAQNSNGSFDCDHCYISYGNVEAMTMMNMIAFARGYDETHDPRYLNVLTKAVGWCLATDYRASSAYGAEYPARVSIGLSAALPKITDSGLVSAIQARIQTINGYLRSLQNPDGSFGTQTTPDYPIIRTAQTLYALALAGTPGTDPQLRAAILWLVNQQRPSGGWVEFNYELSQPVTWMDETTWAMIALPAAFLRLGQFDVDLNVTLPPSSQLVSSSVPVASTQQGTNGTQVTWRFPNVTEAGNDL